MNQNFLSTLRELNDKDKLCLEQKKPAINRISYLTTLRTRLSNAEFTEAYAEQKDWDGSSCLSHGLLIVLNDWLVLEKGLPSYEVCKTMENDSLVENQFDRNDQ